MKIGDVIVTCPSCGTSLQIDVDIHSVTVYRHNVLVTLRDGHADHDCKGRD